MAWDEGLSPDGSRIIMHELSYKEVLSVAGMNQREAAKRLGVDETHFYRVAKRLAISHWFPVSKPRPRRISREDIIDVAKGGVTKKDAADLLGVSYVYLNELVKLWNLRDHFPANGGEAIWTARRGYCD